MSCLDHCFYWDGTFLAKACCKYFELLEIDKESVFSLRQCILLLASAILGI